MKVILIWLLLTTSAFAVSSKELAAGVREANATTWTLDELFIQHKIRKLDAVKRIGLSNTEVREMAHAVAVAHDISGVAPELLLAVMYDETRLCHAKHSTGDGGQSFGCMQVHTYWWGDKLRKAGVSKKELLEIKTGVVVGSLILADFIDTYGFQTGIQRYNGSGEKAKAYRNRVLSIYKLIK